MSQPDEIAAFEDLMGVRERRDEAAFSRLYDAYSPILYRICLLILKNEGEAQEALQDAFVHVWERSQGYDPSRGKIYTWMCLITRSKAIDRLRRNARLNRRVSLTRAGDLEPALTKAPAPGNSPLENSLLHRRAGLVLDLIKRLTPEQAQIIKLAYFDGLSQSEIGLRLKKPLGTVKTRMRAATQKLAALATPEMRAWL